MLVIPAIDIKDGKCVRLKQGNMSEETVYAEDPVAMAQKWVSEGARRLHIVDLDGAVRGAPVNADIIHRIVDSCPETPIQVGGGIRDEDTVDVYIQAGVRYVIIGTQAIKEPHLISDLCSEFPTHIIIGLDARDGKVAIEGWSKLSRHDAINMAQRFVNDGVEGIIYTDISRDGMMQGVNIEATVSLAESVNIPVIASGGISNIEDIRKLASESGSGIIGTIVGRAFYEGVLDFATAQQVADELSGVGSYGL